MTRAGLALALALPLAGCVPAAVPAPPQPMPSATVAPPPAFVLNGAAEQGGLLRARAPEGTVALTLDGADIPFAADRHFLIGLGRDQGPEALLEARLSDGRNVREVIHVAPRSWRIERLPTLPRGTTPTPAFLARREGELARITAARARDTGVDGWRQSFRWPVTGRISGVFGSQRIYAGEPGAPHSGVDVARPTGTPVAAPADGVVVLAAKDPFTLEGRLLILDHGLGLSSAFLHLSRIAVREGDRVTQGSIIGEIGMTGRATGPHLHWGMVWRGIRIDPQPLAGPMANAPAS